MISQAAKILTIFLSKYISRSQIKEEVVRHDTIFTKAIFFVIIK